MDKRVWGKWLFFLMIFSSAIFLGVCLGTYMAIRQTLPSISELEHFTPDIVTSVYSDDGKVIKEFSRQKRIPVSYDQITDVLKKAILATEDPRFFSHKGVDLKGILRAFREDIRLLTKGRRLHGGSTITQQLARLLFLYPQQTLHRKLSEIFLSVQIERKYSKEKILEMYCNLYYFGHGVYGVETASNFFFGKSVSELNLEEAALIAGILRWPPGYSPYTYPERALQRRSHVINRMVEEGFISRKEGEEAKKKPINVLPLGREDSDFGAYFFEEIRKYVASKYGDDALYKGGLKIYTTMNTAFQKYAEDALLKQLRVLDKKKGWRKDKKNLIEEGITDLEQVSLKSWRKSSLEIGDILETVVLSVEKREARVRFKDLTGVMTNSDIQWTRSRYLDSLIKRGDVIHVRLNRIAEDKKECFVSLDQEPRVEGAFLAIDPLIGQIKAMVGGYSFRRSEFNRATQALRQAGSSIKPILYTAALENGFTPATRIVDEPTGFVDRWTGTLWSPPNYDGKYKGTVTLRKGIEESRNIVTAKILEHISPQTGVDYCKKFGITSTIYPYLSLSLGTFEVKLVEMVSAFTSFPNKGIRINPYFITHIEDKEGNILEECKIEAENVISPQTAFLMTCLLQGVIQRGTGESAAVLLEDKPLAGKTGTTDDYTDAWFIGFSPSLCAGVWVGYDNNETLGDRQSGAVAALPVWFDFFKKIIEEEKKKAQEEEIEPAAEEFEVPPNILFVDIDRKTGLLAAPFCIWPFREAFIPGTEPVRYCTHSDHMLILDYYSQEKAKEEH
ncbi:MAG: PBP1A family penicillin-binding protein [Candidatus Aminicenantales bacterium]